MRSKALPPARAQGHIVPFLEAAALFAALCIFARAAALMLAAVTLAVTFSYAPGLSARFLIYHVSAGAPSA